MKKKVSWFIYQSWCRPFGQKRLNCNHQKPWSLRNSQPFQHRYREWKDRSECLMTVQVRGSSSILCQELTSTTVLKETKTGWAFIFEAQNWAGQQQAFELGSPICTGETSSFFLALQLKAQPWLDRINNLLDLIFQLRLLIQFGFFYQIFRFFLILEQVK